MADPKLTPEEMYRRLYQAAVDADLVPPIQIGEVNPDGVIVVHLPTMEPKMESGDKTLGQIAFEAYVQQVQGLTYDNKPIPTWDNLTDAVRAGWEAAAFAARSEPLVAGELLDAGMMLTVKGQKLYRANAAKDDLVVGIATLHAEIGEVVHGLWRPM